MENTYVVFDDTKEAVIIDAGCMYQSEKEQLRQYVEYAQLSIKYVLNTHLHIDHQCGNAFVYDAFGKQPLAHAADAFMIEKLPQQAAAFGISLEDRSQSLGGFLTDGQNIKFGNTQLKVICTPGHSEGGVCFYNEAEGVLFSGDTLFQGSIGRADLPGGNYAQLISSIRERLLCLPDATTVYSGHGQTTTIGYEKEYNPYL